jgi:OOP family OmpA-OmpF porin
MGDVSFATALIEGHTDSVGTEAYNLALSDRRAKSVFDYLTSRGVDPARLSSVGHGELKPIADNATAEGRQLNRRVMLIRTDSGM